MHAVVSAISGYLGTTTSLNRQPPVLLLLRARLAPLSFVADLAGYFIVANLPSLVVLASRHAMPQEVLWPTLPPLVAAAVLGNIAGLWIARRLPADAFRNAVVVLVILAGALTVAVG
jgi:uncharacterized membrane protein YfcA